jgi:hypothetical protein
MEFVKRRVSPERARRRPHLEVREAWIGGARAVLRVEGHERAGDDALSFARRRFEQRSVDYGEEQRVRSEAQREREYDRGAEAQALLDSSYR